MKKRTLKILTLSLLITGVMYNCKKKDEPFPTEPDTELVDEINGIEVEEVAVSTPEAVTSTESSIAVSAKTTETATAISAITPTNIPAAATSAAAEVSGALSTEEVNTLNSVTPEVIAAVSAGGALPANLKAVMDKVAADPTLKAYLPTLTLPTVGGTAISGTRTAIIEGVEAVNGVLVEDACITAANATYATVKTKLDATKASEAAKIAAAYAANIAPLAAAETACQAAIPAKYAALRTQAEALSTSAITTLDAAKEALGANYALLAALSKIQLLGYLSSLNELQAADIKACTAKTTAATTNAAAARDKDLATANANYAAALAKAEASKVKLIESCHNQGGGN
ncbi:hypothetical protein CLV98_11273 [Dyadobacter jejuensis]|uniref:Uncharacterized protein n=1 Tax=Dyadobacter jejuensis TaxID=1082580 RepID=A0A316AFE2_9BACT|nr:hypothetical protein [Dyadobacter jejuensis]PWJ55978.1 hypothetical protein CLV98_11273 [Dyadobacter jejuensis]